MTSRYAALLALLATAGGLVAVLIATTPWSPLTTSDVPNAAVSRALERVAVAPARDFTAAEIAHARAFHDALRPPAYLGLVVGLIAAGVLGLTRLGARLVAAVARPFGGGWAIKVLLGGLAVLAITEAVTVPFEARAHAVLVDYGLSTQGWGGWALDNLRSFGVNAGLTLLVLLGLFALIRAFPRTWWAWVGIGGAATVLAVSFLYPVVIEPVFNTFRPMPAGPLRSSLLEMAHSDGVDVDEVLIADASRRTTALNAYVSGYGATRRIVVYDTLLEQASPEEVRLIVAHELGHAENRDVLHGTLLGALGVAAVACLLYLLLSWTPLRRRAGAGPPGDPRLIPLLLFGLAAGSLIAAPVQNLVSRRIEARADVHALDLTEDPATFASSQRALAVTNLSDPDPPTLLYGLFASHPTAAERIALARAWALAHGMVPVPSLRPAE